MFHDQDHPLIHVQYASLNHVKLLLFYVQRGHAYEGDELCSGMDLFHLDQ
jgi:hypothetical protein